MKNDRGLLEELLGEIWKSALGLPLRFPDINLNHNYRGLKTQRTTNIPRIINIKTSVKNIKGTTIIIKFRKTFSFITRNCKADSFNETINAIIINNKNAIIRSNTVLVNKKVVLMEK